MHPGAYDLLAKRFLNVRKTVFNHGFAVVFKTVWQTHTFFFNINVNGKRTYVRSIRLRPFQPHTVFHINRMRLTDGKTVV